MRQNVGDGRQEKKGKKQENEEMSSRPGEKTCDHRIPLLCPEGENEEQTLRTNQRDRPGDLRAPPNATRFTAVSTLPITVVGRGSVTQDV